MSTTISNLEKKRLELLEEELKLEQSKMFSFDDLEELLGKKCDGLILFGQTPDQYSLTKKISTIETKLIKEEMVLIDKKMEFAREEQEAIENETLEKLLDVQMNALQWDGKQAEWMMQLEGTIRSGQEQRQLRRELEAAKREADEFKREAEELERELGRTDEQLKSQMLLASRELVLLRMDQEDELREKERQLEELEEELKQTTEQTATEEIHWDWVKSQESRELENLRQALAAFDLDNGTGNK